MKSIANCSRVKCSSRKKRKQRQGLNVTGNDSNANIEFQVVNIFVRSGLLRMNSGWSGNRQAIGGSEQGGNLQKTIWHTFNDKLFDRYQLHENHPSGIGFFCFSKYIYLDLKQYCSRSFKDNPNFKHLQRTYMGNTSPSIISQLIIPYHWITWINWWRRKAQRGWIYSGFEPHHCPLLIVEEQV